MEQFAKPGDFCPNEVDPDHRKLQDGRAQRNIKKSGKTKGGVQRYFCNTCKRPLSETRSRHLRSALNSAAR